MTTQFFELETINDQELQVAAGGGLIAGVFDTVAPLFPGVGGGISAISSVSNFFGGPTVGKLVERNYGPAIVKSVAGN